MTYDDDPYNDLGDRRPKSIIRAVVIVVLFCLAVFTIVSWLLARNAKAQDYLPPRRYIQTPQAQDDGPLQYYANDWIVYAPDGRVLCKDPYIELDLKTIRCITTEKWK